MKTLFLVNPRAGKGSGLQVWNRLERLVPRHLAHQVAVPASRDETRRAAAEAVKAGAGRVVVFGGDGTISDVVRELAFTSTVLGVVPVGTGNDVCRNLGIPRAPEAALHLALYGEPCPIDLGRTSGGRYFVNAAGVGFDAEVADRANRLKPGLRGTLPYLAGALSSLTWYKPAQVELSVDGQQYSGPSMMVAIANGRCYGGGMQIAPQARWDDGELDVCIAGSLSRLELLGLLRRVYSGGHVDHPGVRMMRGRRIRLRVRDGVRAHLDGEPLDGGALDFEVCPGALSVAVPYQSLPSDHPVWAGVGESRFGTPDSVLWWDT